jgi:hypothetical protein
MATIPVTLDRNKTLKIYYTPVAITYILSITAQADSTPVGITVTVDGHSVTTPGSATLNAGSYTATAPDSITIGGVVYAYDRYELV